MTSSEGARNGFLFNLFFRNSQIRILANAVRCKRKRSRSLPQASHLSLNRPREPGETYFISACYYSKEDTRDRVPYCAIPAKTRANLTGKWIRKTRMIAVFRQISLVYWKKGIVHKFPCFPLWFTWNDNDRLNQSTWFVSYRTAIGRMRVHS